MSIKTPNSKINLINNRIKYGTDGGINVVSNALVVNATTGRVGINTTNPTSLLDISGSLKASSIADYSNSSGNNTQVLTKVNGQNLWSYSGYNFNGADMFPQNTAIRFGDLSNIPLPRYFGGVLAPNGKIYMVPYQSPNCLILDPLTNSIDITSITNLGTGTNKWQGGCVAPNGKIYCIPRDSTSVLIIDPNNNTADTTTISDLSSQTNKWCGGVLAPNGKIYCIPRNANSVLVINPTTNTKSFITDVSLSTNFNPK